MAKKATTKKKEAEKDLAETYNEFKQFEGQQYSGMKWVGVIDGVTTRETGYR